MSHPWRLCGPLASADSRGRRGRRRRPFTTQSKVRRHHGMLNPTTGFISSGEHAASPLCSGSRPAPYISISGRHHDPCVSARAMPPHLSPHAELRAAGDYPPPPSSSCSCGDRRRHPPRPLRQEAAAKGARTSSCSAPAGLPRPRPPPRIPCSSTQSASQRPPALLRRPPHIAGTSCQRR